MIGLHMIRDGLEVERHMILGSSMQPAKHYSSGGYGTSRGGLGTWYGMPRADSCRFDRMPTSSRVAVDNSHPRGRVV